MFDPAINNLLAHPDWQAWGESILPLCVYPAEEGAAVVQQYHTWRANLIEQQAARAAQNARREAAKSGESSNGEVGMSESPDGSGSMSRNMLKAAVAAVTGVAIWVVFRAQGS